MDLFGQVSKPKYRVGDDVPVIYEGVQQTRKAVQIQPDGTPILLLHEGELMQRTCGTIYVFTARVFGNAQRP